MTLKSTVLALALVSACNLLSAQTKSRETQLNIALTDFNLPPGAAVDSGASAVVLSDSGAVSFIGDKRDLYVDYVFVKKTRIKILNRQGFDAGTVKIRLFGKDEFKDKLEDLQAFTYNTENGKISTVPLNKTDIFEDKLGKYLTETKFTFPNVREGSVLEYSFRIVSRRIHNLPSWRFQYMSYPCLKSNFEIKLPDFLRYAVLRNGIDSITFKSAEDRFDRINVGNVTISTGFRKLTWSAKDIPAFAVQPFIYQPRDYLDKISFDFVSANFSGEREKAPTWQSATAELLTDPYFGAVVADGRAENLRNTMEKITAADDEPLKAARSIYSYVRDNFTCVADDDIYINNDLYEVNKKKQGNVAELNLLLIALLRQKGLKVDPMVLSTREYGAHSETYPSLDKLNYVIARLKMYGDTIYLDASKPELGFGKLPLDCYNGHGRIISDNDTGDVFFPSDAVKEIDQASVFIQNDEKKPGVITGSMQRMPGYHSSYYIRNTIKQKGLHSYLKTIQDEMGNDLPVENATVESLEMKDKPVAVKYDFTWKYDAAADLIYFNPMLTEGYSKNPFTASERNYPVEMDAPTDELYTLNMEIPAGYVIDELPKSAKVAFNGNEGFFEYIVQHDDTNIQLRSRVKLNSAMYQPDEYGSLRDFFAFVVKKQTEQIVFKKKK